MQNPAVQHYPTLCLGQVWVEDASSTTITGHHGLLGSLTLNPAVQPYPTYPTLHVTQVWVEDASSTTITGTMRPALKDSDFDTLASIATAARSRVEAPKEFEPPAW